MQGCLANKPIFDYIKSVGFRFQFESVCYQVWTYKNFVIHIDTCIGLLILYEDNLVFEEVFRLVDGVPGYLNLNIENCNFFYNLYYLIWSIYETVIIPNSFIR